MTNTMTNTICMATMPFETGCGCDHCQFLADVEESKQDMTDLEAKKATVADTLATIRKMGLNAPLPVET